MYITKKNIYFILIAAMTFLSANNYAQEKSHETDVKNVLIKLLAAGKNQNYKEAAKYIVYSGDDEKRNNNDVYNINDRYEMNQVKRIAMQINALLQLSDYRIGDYKATFDEGVTHYNLYVHFISGEQEIMKRFQFLKAGDLYLLDLID